MNDANIRNRCFNCTNPYQGKFKKVLCICSAGLLRSPTAAFVLSQEPFNFNTRAAGIVPQFALIPVDEVLLSWADEIVCMSNEQQIEIIELLKQIERETPVFNLHVPDNYPYRNEQLMEIISKHYVEQTGWSPVKKESK